MAKAIAKYIRMSPRKLRRVINEIRGKDAYTAQTILRFMPYAAAKVVEKVLKSAVSNAKENEKLNPDELRITKAFVDQSNTLRRWRPMSRGRGYPILKRTSHVTVEVNHDEKLVGATKSTHVRKETKHVHDHNHEHEHTHDHDHGHDHHDEHKTKEKAVKKEKKQVKEKTKPTKKDKKKEKED